MRRQYVCTSPSYCLSYCDRGWWRVADAGERGAAKCRFTALLTPRCVTRFLVWRDSEINTSTAAEMNHLTDPRHSPSSAATASERDSRDRTTLSDTRVTRTDNLFILEASFSLGEFQGNTRALKRLQQPSYSRMRLLGNRATVIPGCNVVGSACQLPERCCPHDSGWGPTLLCDKRRRTRS